MGGVIYAGILTNFQSISFFPVLLETKGFLTRQEAKSFLIWTPKSCWQGLYAGNKNSYQKASVCKGGVQNYINNTKASKELDRKIAAWLHENSFPHIPTWIFSSAFYAV